MSAPLSFSYVGLDIDPRSATVTCTYGIGDETFTEVARLPGADLTLPGVRHAAELYFLLAGVSYFKTRAPLVIDLGPIRTTAAERTLVASYFLHGLGEFAFTNQLDLSGLEITGPDVARHERVGGFDQGRLLIPFGGGLDSIVTVSELADQADDAALFVAERPGARFDAIERPAAITGLPVVRAERILDDKVLASSAHGYLTGHVPVTGIISALAVLAAVGGSRGAVAMSNERSASSASRIGPSGPVNHQWSKSLAFEQAFRALLAGRLQGFAYFSWLRDRSELSIAETFATLDQFHRVFRSCNRSFTQDPARRLDRWCGECDKCLFIDLVLAPFVGRTTLAEIFDGEEPLENDALIDQLEVLVGATPGARPFECIGDEAECREALLLAAARDDRAANASLQSLAARITPVSTDQTDLPRTAMIPERYAAPARLG